MCETNLSIEANNCQTQRRSENFILLQNFSNLRTGQDQVLWNIIGAFWATNSLLIVSILSTNIKNIYKVGLYVSIIGLVISILWAFMQCRAIKRLTIYEKAIKSIEEELCLSHCAFFVKEGKQETFQARDAMKCFSRIAILFWLGVIIYCMYKLT